MLRIILGTIAGVVVAFVVIFAIDAVNHALYPPPEAVRVAAEKFDFEAIQKAVREWLPQVAADGPRPDSGRLGCRLVLGRSWALGSSAASRTSRLRSSAV